MNEYTTTRPIPCEYEHFTSRNPELAPMKGNIRTWNRIAVALCVYRMFNKWRMVPRPVQRMRLLRM